MPNKSPSAYTHLKKFVRHAPPNQVDALIREVGREMLQRIEEKGDENVYLSTSGLGVSWLHMRMDARPKYYTYQPYKER